MERIICSESIMIETNLPIQRLLDMEIKQQLNDHGRLHFQIVIDYDKQQEFIKKSYFNEQVRIFDNRPDEPVLLFSGKITSISRDKKNDVLTASIHVISYTIDLDHGKKRRSFQNPDMTFEQVAHQVIKDSQARFIWRLADKKIDRPFIQLEETDWQFLIRLASHFNFPLQASSLSHQPNFYFGIRHGKEQILNEAEILEFGNSRSFYQNGGYVAGDNRYAYAYLKVKHQDIWEIGDYVQFQGRQLTVVQCEIKFEKGRVSFIDTLGDRGLLYCSTVYNQALSGVQLQGTIKNVQHESVFIQFNFDHVDQADYPWEWTPEVGNLCYIMPEIGSRVIVTFPSNDEKEATATHLLRSNGNFISEQHRCFSTIHHQLLGLYPDELLLQNPSNKIRLKEQQGIQFNSAKNITIDAKGDITLNAKQLFVQAPHRILMQTNESNIELCKTFNIYAPQGVTTDGTDGNDSEKEQQKGTSNSKTQVEDDHWQLSYRALGSVSNTNLNQLEDDHIVRLHALGSVPKLSGSQEIIVMSEVMAGTPVSKTSFPRVLSDMENYTFNGGYYISEE
ncbi:MAG: phage late control D family protein [Defluviitaleaceae bacterium]|nr:phage late control D family protein [Defluviitaleaceae bacterium]